MPNTIILTHKSRKYSDEIMEEPTEICIREMVFRCWIDAYQAGYEDAIKNYGNIREDMGR